MKTIKTLTIVGSVLLAASLTLTGCSQTPAAEDTTSTTVPSEIKPEDIKIQPVEMASPKMFKLADIANANIEVSVKDWIVVNDDNLADWICSTTNEEVAVCSQSTDPHLTDVVMPITVQRFTVGSTAGALTNTKTGEVITFNVKVS